MTQRVKPFTEKQSIWKIFYRLQFLEFVIFILPIVSYLGCCGGVPEFQVRKKLLAQIRRLIPRNRKMKTGTINIVWSWHVGFRKVLQIIRISSRIQKLWLFPSEARSWVWFPVIRLKFTLLHSALLVAFLPPLNVFVKLPTCPSPKPTLTLISHLGQNVGLGEG